MPVHPYIDPDKLSPEVLPQESLLLIIVAPFVSCFGILGAFVFSSGLPSLFLLAMSQENPALALLRVYRAGYMISCVLATAAPFVYGALVLWLFRVWGRKMDPKTVLLSLPAFIVLAGLLLIVVTVGGWGVMLWRAELPQLCVQYSAEIRQLEAGELEHMTLLLDEGSSPKPMPGAPSDDLTLHCRGALGRDTGYEWITLHIPDALEFTPVPDSFVTPGQTYGWNWENQQKYEVYYTSEFHLVETITPVS
ncbi:hypothetical protein D1646_03760 [Pseudoflavonifractor sp. 60]|uniref:hypothetical protein n=1 Tax=Pseudoflavonifractor sp. 60 TaxID=2304576 RepID=UPI00136BB095|nr:hypothetical protein [Pseudoflavonifractor sp. 60]NBI65941.1 hypothetical protein [Pseudoflavonifractor sp. 60]